MVIELSLYVLNAIFPFLWGFTILIYERSPAAEEETRAAYIKWQSIIDEQHEFLDFGISSRILQDLCVGLDGNGLVLHLSSHAAISKYLNYPHFFGGESHLSSASTLISLPHLTPTIIHCA